MFELFRDMDRVSWRLFGEAVACLGAVVALNVFLVLALFFPAMRFWL